MWRSIEQCHVDVMGRFDRELGQSLGDADVIIDMQSATTLQQLQPSKSSMIWKTMNRSSRNVACDEDACQMHFWKHGPPMKNPEIHGPITRIYRGTWAFRAWWTPIASPSVANLRWPVCRTGIRTAESLVNISPGFCIVVISFPLISWGCSWGLSFESGFVSGIHRIYDDIWDWPFGDWTVCNGKSTMFDL